MAANGSGSRRAQPVRWKIARRHLNQRRSHRLRWSLLLLFLLLLTTTGASGAAGLYFAAHLPPASLFHVHYDFQDARFYDAQGDQLFNMADLSKRAGKRIVEPLQNRGDAANACRNGVNRIPTLLQNATIATEDATFYKNPGFDPWSIARAAYQDVRYGHIVSGASTITQQLVRANILNNNPTLSRKAQEVALSYEISKRVPKRKILWYYLNSVPYGNTAIGAQAAAQVYFNERACSLDLAQAAFLAGLPQAPTTYDPVRHRAAALHRMHEVLTLMRKHGYLHWKWQIRAAESEAQFWEFQPPQAPMRYPQFVHYVIDQIGQMPKLRGRLFSGIDVYTTLQPHLQDLAQAAVKQQIDGLGPQHVTDGALVSLDLRPQHYGWIMAMVGSAHYGDQTGQINMAVTPRQPGSSMKPFNYIYALAHNKIGPGTTIQDVPVKLPDPNNLLKHGWYEPENYDHRWHNSVTLRQALANSLNVPAVKLEYYLTHPENVARTAQQFGMSSLYRDNPGLACSVCYALTLGGLSKGTRLLEETSAYGTFGTGGVNVPPVAIWKVVQRNTGKILWCSADCPAGVQPEQWLTNQRRRVVDERHVYEMTSMLADNEARCTVQVCEFGPNSPLLLSRPAAAKTGTTNSFTDNWTLGYTPQIVTGVWAGNADRSPMFNVIGVTGAAPIWHQYMEGAFKILRLPAVPFVPPVGVYRYDRCDAGKGTYHLVSPDLYVPLGQELPLCSVHERGYMPVPCSRYPRNQSGFPYLQDCNQSGPVYRYTINGYTYTYQLGPNGQVPSGLPQGSVPLPQNGLPQSNGYPQTNGYPQGQTNSPPVNGFQQGVPQTNSSPQGQTNLP